MLCAFAVDQGKLHDLAFGGGQDRIGLPVDLAAYSHIDHAAFGDARTQRVSRIGNVTDIGAGRSGR